MPKVVKKTRTANTNIPVKIKCQKCEKEQSNTNYYNTNSDIMPKYPICKKCLQEIINPSDMQSIYKILKDMDIGFMKSVWDSTCISSPDNPFGSYIRQMNSLPQYKGTQWSGSVFANSEDTDDYTSEGRIHSDEWMGDYSQIDLEYLNSYYKSLKQDFKIVTRNHIDYARKIAKASLAMDKAYESMLNGGSESKYKSMKEIFDSLSKSAQFAESQRGINDVSLGCFGVIFDKVEKRKYVPEHQPDEKDIYDNLLEQFSNIEKSL